MPRQGRWMWRDIWCGIKSSWAEQMEEQRQDEVDLQRERQSKGFFS